MVGAFVMDVKVAICRSLPALPDLESVLCCALDHLEIAVGEGSKIIVLPDTCTTGYPAWSLQRRPGRQAAPRGLLHGQIRQNAFNIASGDLDPICLFAATHEVVIVVGITEVDDAYSSTTKFSTNVIIGTDGCILNRHRKLLPADRDIIGQDHGEAVGLKVVETPFGRIGTLACRERYLPLARFALYAQNIDIFIVPSWESAETWLASLGRIAREGGCWVLGSMAVGRETSSVVIKPYGDVGSGDEQAGHNMVYAMVDLKTVRVAISGQSAPGRFQHPQASVTNGLRPLLPPIIFRDQKRAC